jgi:hypothetical protein
MHVDASAAEFLLANRPEFALIFLKRSGAQLSSFSFLQPKTRRLAS